jgi:hypothetical protein|tara:strand:+ start:346 stop:540 length:195 start_codon:yes stop_codon:yes gene_type:complete
MYFREHIVKKLEHLEAKLKHIEFHTSRGDGEEIIKVKEQCEELVEDLKATVEREPRTSNEENRY